MNPTQGESANQLLMVSTRCPRRAGDTTSMRVILYIPPLSPPHAKVHPRLVVCLESEALSCPKSPSPPSNSLRPKRPQTWLHCLDLRRTSVVPIETNPFLAYYRTTAGAGCGKMLGFQAVDIVLWDRRPRLSFSGAIAFFRSLQPASDALDSAHRNNTIRYPACGPDSRELAAHPLRSGLG
jgi:hypothetical protein